MSARKLQVAGTHVLFEELGSSGEPVVIIQTALSVDELAPLSRALSDDCHVWHLRRPGYGGLPAAAGEASITGDADAVVAALDALGLGTAHVVGASYSAAVALRLAYHHPDRVRSLTLVEPPPSGTAGAEEFRSANAGLLAAYRSDGVATALEYAMRLIDGPHWRADAERTLPGSVAQMERDAETFLARDVPALIGWALTDAEARSISCSVLLIGGGASGSWFAQMLDRLEQWLPASRRVTVPGAGHDVSITHSVEVATAVKSHVRQSPRRGDD